MIHILFPILRQIWLSESKDIIHKIAEIVILELEKFKILFVRHPWWQTFFYTILTPSLNF